MATRRVLGRAGGGRPGHDHALPPGSSHGPRLLLMHWACSRAHVAWITLVRDDGGDAAEEARVYGHVVGTGGGGASSRLLFFFFSSSPFLIFSVYRFRSSCISSSFLIFFSFSSPFSSFHPFPVRAEFWSSFSHSFSSPSVLPTLLS